MTIEFLESENNTQWNQFVLQQPEGTFYHLWEWKSVIEKAFKKITFYLLALENGRIEGILPLVLCDHIFFGRMLVSMPFLNCGGICAANQSTAIKLLEKAKSLTCSTRAKYLELRHNKRVDNNLPVLTHKVSMTIPLSGDSEILWSKLSGKVRTEVRKAEKLGLYVKFGQLQYLNDFYDLFLRNYKSQGTPAYPKRFFTILLEELSPYVMIFVVYWQNKPVGAAMNGYFKNRVEGLWAPSLAFIYPNLRINYLLYWEMIKHACIHGYQFFHLGRSSKDTGAIKFKEKWLAVPSQLYWEYFLNINTQLPRLNIENPKYQLPIKIWQHLPMGITRMVGPLLSPGIP